MTAKAELPGGSYMDDALLSAERYISDAVESLQRIETQSLEALDGPATVDAEWAAMATGQVKAQLETWLVTVGEEVKQLRKQRTNA